MHQHQVSTLYDGVGKCAEEKAAVLKKLRYFEAAFETANECQEIYSEIFDQRFRMQRSVWSAVEREKILAGCTEMCEAFAAKAPAEFRYGSWQPALPPFFLCHPQHINITVFTPPKSMCIDATIIIDEIPTKKNANFSSSYVWRLKKVAKLPQNSQMCRTYLDSKFFSFGGLHFLVIRPRGKYWCG